MNQPRNASGVSLSRGRPQRTGEAGSAAAARRGGLMLRSRRDAQGSH